MSNITTHVLETSTGRPGIGIAVELSYYVDGAWQVLGTGETDDDGRVGPFLGPDQALTAGTYRLRFATGAHASRRGTATFYPHVDIHFNVHAPAEHFHVPLLLNPFGYTTYRGS